MSARIKIVSAISLFAICPAVFCDSQIVFEKQKLSDSTYEAACAADLNNDGKLDIVCGEYWYQGPEFKQRYKMCELMMTRDYYDDFGVYPMDVDGDGFMDIVSGGWFGKTLSWRQNPKGKTSEWTVHKIEEVGSIERPCFWDIDGDGYAEIIPNMPRGPLIVFKLLRDASGKGTGEFKKHEISSQFQGHGLGYGDINGDGRKDFILSAGWFEAPAKPFEQEWKWHADFDFVKASVPIIVHDISGDGRNDLIVGSGHGYGLVWLEQSATGTWIRHELDMKNSQYHELRLADLDNDGAPELVTGKRYHAHSGKDPGAEDPVGLYYYTLKNGKPRGVTIDYGPAGEASGAGIYMWIADVDANGWNDIVAPGKDGLYLFKNQGAKKAARSKTSAKGGKGFVPLFNGKNLDGWHGDPQLWKAENGVIVGSTTEENPLKQNSFLSTKKSYGDFILRIKVKLGNHNSGVQFRSEQRDDYVVAGYQADVAEKKYFGMLYKEKSGGIMAYWKALTPEEQQKIHAASKQGDWNEYEITCRGDRIKMTLNGYVTCDIQDPEGAKDGVIALQLHKGGPMQASFKDIYIREL
ncbi:MAG: DUF1080 domain-containing protein [Kiritimatiellales bacterium]|nr:DUF1080 domain-containing protein [Kiritimatiellales bacterium]